MITAAELARRLCVSEHPFYGTTAAAVPCGTHLAQARNWLYLITPDGSRARAILNEAATEAERPPVEPEPERPNPHDETSDWLRLPEWMRR